VYKTCRTARFEVLSEVSLQEQSLNDKETSRKTIFFMYGIIIMLRHLYNKGI
jgi:hypothetical protein